MIGAESFDMDLLEKEYEDTLESVFPCNIPMPEQPVDVISASEAPVAKPRAKIARPHVLIPVFPGTNCEYDTARAFEAAGAVPEILVINNLTSEGVRDSAQRVQRALANSQILFLPGGFSGGDEPDGSGKFITAFLKNPMVREQLDALLARDGLIGGICNGFQALIKLGLVPFGEISQIDQHSPTLTYNTIARHQSRLIRARVCSNRSPWLMLSKVGDVHLLPISHGEGRFVIEQDLMERLVQQGQIATQYVDENGLPSMDIHVNPNGSMYAVEGILSPDGRVFGRMAHAERRGRDLYKNVPGEKDCRMFESAVLYYS